MLPLFALCRIGLRVLWTADGHVSGGFTNLPAQGILFAYKASALFHYSQPLDYVNVFPEAKRSLIRHKES